MIGRKFYSFLFYIVSFLGLVYQIEEIVSIYLEFRTIAEITISVPSDIEPPDLSVCFRYADIIDVTQLNAAHNVTLKSDRRNYINPIQSLVTIKDIFMYTPGEDNVFRKCSSRPPHDYNLNEYNGSDCYTSFNVSKFVMQEFVCYRFSLLATGNEF